MQTELMLTYFFFVTSRLHWPEVSWSQIPNMSTY